MFGNEELIRLQSRKRELVAQSDLHRALVLVECQNLRAILAGLERGVDAFQRTRPFWPILAPLLGFALARKRRAISSILRNVAWLCGVMRMGFAFRDAWLATTNRKD